jgi:lipoyl(octanoyl) transferase
MNLISVVQLDIVDYATGLQLQQRLVNLRKDGLVGDVVLLLEHTPVITLGRNAKAKNILVSSEELSQRGVEVFECDRGGDVTFHGPGQLVAYPIFDLRGFPVDGKPRTLGAVEYVRRLEEVLIRTCADFGIAAKRIPGLTGVWTDRDSTARIGTGDAACPDESKTRQPSTKHEAKIAAIGVHISRGFTSHGFALNVNTDLSYFNLIVPCGIEARPVTSLEKELGKRLPLQEVAHSISRNIGVVFNGQILWLETLDALLRPTEGVPVKAPDELRKLHKDEEIFWA